MLLKVLEGVRREEHFVVGQTRIYHLYFQINQAASLSPLVSLWHSAEFESDPRCIQKTEAASDVHVDGWGMNGCSAVHGAASSIKAQLIFLEEI